MNVDDYAERLLCENREELERVDSKANFALGVMLAVLGGVGWVSLDSESALRTAGRLAEVLVALGLVAALASIVLLGVAVLPRVGRVEPGRARFFREQAQFSSPDELLKAATSEAAEAGARVAQQVHVLAGLLDRKYLLVRSAYVAGAASLVSIAMAGALAFR